MTECMRFNEIIDWALRGNIEVKFIPGHNFGSHLMWPKIRFQRGDKMMEIPGENFADLQREVVGRHEWIWRELTMPPWSPK